MAPYFLMAASALILAVGGTPLVRLAAIRLGILDKPASRKIHTNPVPLMGGAAIYIAFIVVLFFFGDQRYISEAVSIFVGATLISLLGVIDDRLFHNILDIFVTLIWVVGITNAINYWLL